MAMVVGEGMGGMRQAGIRMLPVLCHFSENQFRDSDPLKMVEQKGLW